MRRTTMPIGLRSGQAPAYENLTMYGHGVRIAGQYGARSVELACILHRLVSGTDTGARECYVDDRPPWEQVS
jgi:hypothetical protein